MIGAPKLDQSPWRLMYRLTHILCTLYTRRSYVVPLTGAMPMHLPLTDHRRLLGAYLRPQWARMLLLTLLILAGIALQLLSPQILGYFINATQTTGATSTLVAAALLYLVVGMVRHGMTLATVAVSLDVGWQATNALRGDLLTHVLRLDMPFHKTHTPGELIERVDGDVSVWVSSSPSSWCAWQPTCS